MASSHSIEFQHALSLSPLTPKDPNSKDPQIPIALELTQIPGKKKRDDGPFSYTTEELDTKRLAEWTPEKVAQWMHNAGVGLNDCDFFVENDITGAILITLKFEDLKELGIPSFGVRTKIWEEIHNMRNIRKPEVVMETDIEDAPDKQARRELRRQGSSVSKKRFKPKFNDVISPLESVSIVGIEQMIPRPHKCSKGENCAKWKRNQRLIEAFKQDHPFVDMEKGGIIMVAGDPGNAALAAINAENLAQPRLPPIDDVFRPVSDAIPSVVASSDVMGPGNLPPFQYLEAATLGALQQRDPQDNVRQFLDFQKQHPSTSSEVPPTPPFEIFPAQKTPHQGLRSLPKLSIPGQVAPPRRQQHPLAATPMVSDVETIEDSPEEATPTAPYRFGTPFSEMDVPVTAVNLGPVARNASQSVPPDMNYRHNPAPPKRSVSRASGRRPSFPVMPALDENSIVSPINNQSGRSFAQRAAASQRPIQPPPRVQYPWTQHNKTYEKAIAPIPGSACASATSSSSGMISAGGAIIRHHSPPTGSQSSDMTNGDALSYQGLMKKRKTKMLRHEWHEHYFTLRGTRLAMHKDPAETNRTLEYIDVDDYAIACSSLASTSKLNAAFKAMNIRSSSSKAKEDIAAFSFQLIPQDQKGGVKLRKRESAVPWSAHPSSTGSMSSFGSVVSEGVNGTGKTHHFAVKSRDDRIDWMRELMLAKALKQKGEGVEISVNGNMI
jgi:hypothetical protein